MVCLSTDTILEPIKQFMQLCAPKPETELSFCDYFPTLP